MLAAVTRAQPKKLRTPPPPEPCLSIGGHLLPDLVFTLLSHSLGMMNGSKKGSKKDPAEVFKICKDVRGAASRHLSARQRYT